MTIYLYPLSPADLRALAAGEVPAGLPGAVTDGALPPAFVAQRSLRQLAEGADPQWCSTFLIARASDHAIVGACGFKNEPAERCVEIGYGVAPACRKRGIAAMAVRELLRIAFDSGEADAVLACISAGNVPSSRLARSLGFEDRGTAIDEDGEPLVQWYMRRPSLGEGGQAVAGPPST